MNNPIPIIDISPFRLGGDEDKRKVGRALDAAFAQVGFAIVTGHGLEEDRVARLYLAAKSFFGLPIEKKRAFEPVRRADNIGYLPMGIESVAATLGEKAPPDLCEAMVFRSFFQEKTQSAGSDEQRWRNPRPKEPADFQALAEAYYWEVDKLASTLFRIVAYALDLAEDYFESMFQEHWNTLRIVNYPDQIEDPLLGQLRYGAHTDYGGLTILRQDSAPGGLEICDQIGQWREAPVIPGSFIINIGDMMSRWTNGRWRSTLHRVTNPPRHISGSAQRLSIVAFVRPDDEVEVSCLPTCLEPGEPPRFAPFKSGDWSRGKIKASAFDEARPDGG